MGKILKSKDKTKNWLKACLLFLVFIFQTSSAYPQTIISEIIALHAEDKLLLLDVAKKYPAVKFNVINEPNKTLKLTIELLDSTYHKSYTFDDEKKKELLANLDFISNITVEQLADDLSNKLLVVLEFKDSINRKDFKPHILSTRDNLVKIIFLNEQNIQEEQLHVKYNRALEEQLILNLDKAESLYKEVLLKDQNLFFAKYNLAKLYIDKEQYTEAINLLLPLIDRQNPSPTSSGDLPVSLDIFIVRNILGYAYYLNGDLDKSRAQFDEVLKTKPDSYEANFNIGLLNEKAKDLKKAKLFFQKVIELRPDLAEAYYHLGIMETIEKNKKSAIKYFTKVIELTPESELGKLSQNELNNINNKLESNTK